MKERKKQHQACYDADLNMEAYQLFGNIPPFPNHIHTYYVIGVIHSGRRCLRHKGDAYPLSSGDLILLNPKDNHLCLPLNQEILDYRALNVPVETMQKAVYEITRQKFLPHFTKPVIKQTDLALSVCDLYDTVVKNAPRLEKEETFFLLLEQLLRQNNTSQAAALQEKKAALIEKTCAYLEQHFAQNVSLDDLTATTNLSKSHLLHIFTKETGVTPYRYLQSIRIEKAKQLLKQGEAPALAAYQTGFSDQSHFSRFFKTFIGLTPKQYQKIFPLLEQESTTTKEALLHETTI